MSGTQITFKVKKRQINPTCNNCVLLKFVNFLPSYQVPNADISDVTVHETLKLNLNIIPFLERSFQICCGWDNFVLIFGTIMLSVK